MSPWRSVSRVRVAIAAVAALTTVALSVELFPYHSFNHDEGVYLQQARLLLEGELWIRAAEPDRYRWWFFIQDGPRLIPKYAPLPAAIFAGGMALGEARLALGLIAAANVYLLGAFIEELFDRPTGTLAAGIAAVTPLFLVQSAVFLPYATVMALNLLFALAYTRAMRTRSGRYAGLAGLAVGLSFFSRPYTALLFALPFGVHTLVTLLKARGDRSGAPSPSVASLAGGGLLVATAGLVLTLGYNSLVTGDPLVFPYQRFAPLDGIGFGPREILTYERRYTLPLALEANGRVLAALAGRWSFVPPVGFGLAAIGAVLTWSEAEPSRTLSNSEPSGPTRTSGLRLVLTGLVITITTGNVYFWGNLNILGNVELVGDGLIGGLGPFYHLDLVVPLSGLAAVALLRAWRERGRIQVRSPAGAGGRDTLVAVLVVGGILLGAVGTGLAVADPLTRHQSYTDRYEQAYEPFEQAADGRWQGGPFGTTPAFDDALVLVPAPYGQWLGHPFQSLQNDAGLDGSVVYALQGDPRGSWGLIDSHQSRELYRYDYRGRWPPSGAHSIDARLQRLETPRRTAQTITTTVGVVGSPSMIRLEGGDRPVTYEVDGDPGERLSVEWRLESGQTWLEGEHLMPRGKRIHRYEGATDLTLGITFVQSGGATVTYRQEVSVRPDGESVEILWPGETRVCTLTPRCGRDATYLGPGSAEIAGASVVSTLSAAEQGR